MTWQRHVAEIDRIRQPHYIDDMDNDTAPANLHQELERLEAQVGTLLKLIERLSSENRSLRTQQESLSQERAGLLEKHDQVRNRVDAIVSRLKSLETGA
jgi:cell division protein ZapB